MTHSNITEEPIDNDFVVSNYDYYEKEPPKNYVQWNRQGSTFIPCSETCPEITPGYYNITTLDGRIFFNRISFSLQGLIDFPNSNANEIISDIEYFWGRKERYLHYKIPFKRGIFMSGPQGTGKTSVIKIIMMNIIKRGGICIRFSEAEDFEAGLSALRSIQPNLPVLVIMEDFDQILRYNRDSKILNLLDGASSFGDIVYLATTNEPDSIPDNLLDRPGRFARHFVIDVPCEKVRRLFFENKLFSEDLESISLDKWVSDTEGFSIDHLKALIEQVIIMGYDYEKSLTQLRNLRHGISDDDSDDSDDDSDDSDEDCASDEPYPAPHGSIRNRKSRRGPTTRAISPRGTSKMRARA